MNRRSFLRMLGLAPVAVPALAQAVAPATGTIRGAGFLMTGEMIEFESLEPSWGESFRDPSFFDIEAAVREAQAPSVLGVASDQAGDVTESLIADESPSLGLGVRHCHFTGQNGDEVAEICGHADSTIVLAPRHHQEHGPDQNLQGQVVGGQSFDRVSAEVSGLRFVSHHVVPLSPAVRAEPTA